MIASLKGTLTEIDLSGESASRVVIDVAGVGYLVHVGARTASMLEKIGSTVLLSIYTHVREDAFMLYGFSSREERSIFEALLSAHGVGPSLALAVLSALSPDALCRAVEDEDLDTLSMVPGIGRKTAQRLVLDLQSRLSALPVQLSGPAGTSTHARDLEVREALVALGYGPEEIRGALERASGAGSTEQVLRDALRELAPTR